MITCRDVLNLIGVRYVAIAALHIFYSGGYAFSHRADCVASQQALSQRADVWENDFDQQHSNIIGFHQTFSFDPYPDRQGAIVNEFLLKIAESNNKLRIFTSYQLTGKLNSHAGVDDASQCLLYIQLYDLSFEGDITYRGFSLERMLMPDKFSFSVGRLDDQGQLMSTQVISGVPLPVETAFPDDTLLFSVSLPDAFCLQSEAGIHLGNIHFYYSEAIFDRFALWLEALDGYFEANDLISHVPELIQQLNYDDPEQIILDEFRLCEAEQKLSTAKYALFHRWLNLGNGDPRHFLAVHDSLSLIVDSLRYKFNHSLSVIDDLFYEKGSSYEAVGELQKAILLYQRALIYNPIHIPAHLSLASYELGRQEPREALTRMAGVISQMYPSGEWLLRARSLAANIIDTLFWEAVELNKENRYLDALNRLQSVSGFCEAVDGHYSCPERLSELKSMSHQGMFYSYLLVSERALQSDNLRYCRIYLDSAMAYHQEHFDYISDIRTAERLLLRLVARHRELGDALYEHGDTEGASMHYSSARDVCEQHHFLNCAH